MPPKTLAAYLDAVRRNTVQSFAAGFAHVIGFPSNSTLAMPPATENRPSFIEDRSSIYLQAFDSSTPCSYACRQNRSSLAERSTRSPPCSSSLLPILPVTAPPITPPYPPKPASANTFAGSSELNPDGFSHHTTPHPLPCSPLVRPRAPACPAAAPGAEPAPPPPARTPLLRAQSPPSAPAAHPRKD